VKRWNDWTLQTICPKSDDTRFKWHNRFLRNLREDTLLIVDNFNVTASQDQLLDVMLKHRCRILFTTCSRYENHISLEVGELNSDTLLELMASSSRKWRKAGGNQENH